jgi:hypothetical protein
MLFLRRQGTIYVTYAMAIETLVAGLGFRKTTATLRLWGDSLDPEEVSKALGCEPTEKWRKGDPHPTVAGRVATFGMWSLKAAGHSSGSIEAQVSWLLSLVTNDAAVWGELSVYERDIFTGGWINRWNTSFEMNANVLRELGTRLIPITFDLYLDESLTGE